MALSQLGHQRQTRCACTRRQPRFVVACCLQVKQQNSNAQQAQHQANAQTQQKASVQAHQKRQQANVQAQRKQQQRKQQQQSQQQVKELQVVRDILASAGATRVALPSKDTRRSIKVDDTLYTTDSIELIALFLNSLKGRTEVLPKGVFKAVRPAILEALLGAGNQAKLREEIALLATKRVPAYHGNLGSALAMADTTLDWVRSVKTKREWKTIMPLLKRVYDAGPVPPVQVLRDGAAAERWSFGPLRAAAQGSGWTFVENAERVDVPHARGVKGEADGLLLDASGLCQAILEVKVGGEHPYLALYKDIQKLRRLIGEVQGGTARFTSLPTAESAQQQATNPPEIEVRFAQAVTPCYLVVADDAALKGMEADEVISQAERKLARVGISMALCSASEWMHPDTQLVSVDSNQAVVRVRPGLVQTMRKKVSGDFFDVLSTCDVWQIERPKSANW